MRASEFYTEVEYLYNLTSIDNLTSIFKYGILSKNNLKRYGIKNSTDISDPNVQKIRDNVNFNMRNVKNTELHNYANVFFNPRNSMMSKILNRKERRVDLNSICVICIDKEIIDLGTTFITDKNAAIDDAMYMEPKEAFKALDFKIIKTRFWDDYTRPFLSAEVLVAGCIYPEHFRKIKVGTIEALNRVKALNLGIEVEIDSYMFSLKKMK